MPAAAAFALRHAMLALLPPIFDALLPLIADADYAPRCRRRFLLPLSLSMPIIFTRCRLAFRLLHASWLTPPLRFAAADATLSLFAYAFDTRPWHYFRHCFSAIFR
jgi:hypothetical protein